MLNKRSIHLNCLSASVGNAGLELLHVDASLLERLEERGQRALGPIVVKEDILLARMHIVLILFVDGVVCQVHECFLEVGLSRCFVARGAEAGQSLIVEEGLHGVKADDNDVDAQVKLDAIEE